MQSIIFKFSFKKSTKLIHPYDIKFNKKHYLCTAKALRSDARVAEEARLESVYTSKAYRGFESPSLR